MSPAPARIPGRLAELNEDVRRLDVTVYETTGVGVCQGLQHLIGDARDLFDLQSTFFTQNLTQIAALEQLPCHKGEPVFGVAEVEELDCVGVIELLSEPGLPFKASQDAPRLGLVRSHELESDLGICPHDTSVIDSSEAALSEEPENGVLSSDDLSRQVP